MLQTLALEYGSLDLIPNLQIGMRNVLENYRAILKSSQNELNLMVKINHARVASRIGFVAQDLKAFQAEVIDSIQNFKPDEQINDECFLEAERTLNGSFQAAGESIVAVAQKWKSTNDYLANNILFQTIDKLQIRISRYEKKLFAAFAELNAVTDFDELLSSFQSEITDFDGLFEYFVYNFLDDMFVYDITTKELNKAMFKELNEGWKNFQDDGNSVLESLKNCQNNRNS